VNQVLQGKLKLGTAAALLGVSKEMLWYHIQHHELQPEEQEPLPENLEEVLEDIAKKLRQRLNYLFSLSVTPQNEKTICTVISQMRGLIMDIARLTRRLRAQPMVQVLVMQKLQTAILSILCPECKKRVLEYLEQEPSEVVS